jgi:poly(3-hydroxybutyrate) depolymerase
MHFRGTADSVVPYAGGLRPGGMTYHGGAEATLDEWGEINMCTGEPQPLAGQSACETYPMCADGAETTLCSVPNGSHCGSYRSFGIVELSWEMFQRHALP